MMSLMSFLLHYNTSAILRLVVECIPFSHEATDRMKVLIVMMGDAANHYIV